VLAPEVVAGLAVAEKLQGGRQQHHAAPSNGNNGRPSSSPPSVIDANGPQQPWTPGSSNPDQPAAGRSNQAAGRGQQRQLPSPPPPPIYENDIEDYWTEPPVPGRQPQR
jgi:hypothetical protein